MMKSGAAAVLAIASLSGAATAQSLSSQPACAYMHCIGPEPGDNTTCCEGSRCVQKNEHYAQCLPNNIPVPELWVDGSVLLDRSPPGTVASGGPVAPATPVTTPAAPEIADDDVEDAFAPGPAMLFDDEDLSAGEGPGEAPLEPGVPADAGDVVDADYDDDYAMPPIEIPDELLDIGYVAFVGRDYHPLQATAGSVAVADIPNGSYNVTSPMECEDLCTVTPGCNAASYYLNGEALGGVNCWLKTLEDTCELPADATFDENAVYLLQIDESCTEALAPLGLDAEGPFGFEDALAPGAVIPDILPVDEVPLAAPFDPTPRQAAASPTVPIPDAVASPPSNSNGAASVSGAIIALAVAGAAALF